MMDLDSDSDMVPNSVQSSEIDLDDDLGFSNESETDSNAGNGDTEHLLEQVDNLSSDECSDSDNSENHNDANDVCNADPMDINENIPMDDLCVDLDNLGSNNQNGDEMFDSLQKDPEWSETFLPIHVNQFNQLTGSNLPQDFNMDTASPLEYFQLFFSNEVMEKIVQNTNAYVQYSVQQKKFKKPDYTECFWTDTWK